MKKKKKKSQNSNLKQILVQGIVIFIVIVLLCLSAFTISLYFYTRESKGEVVFPDSPLTKLIETTHSYVGDNTLDISIQCPSIPVIMSVGGTERGVSEHGCVFRYNNRLSISVYEIEGVVQELLSGEFAPNLYNGEISGDISYIEHTTGTDAGFFNGYPAEYHCGTIYISSPGTYDSKEIYVISLTLDMGYDKNVMVAVSTSDTASLYDAEVLLESISYTIMDISGANTSVENEYDFESYTTTSGFPHVTYETQLEESAASEDIIIEIPLTRNYEAGAVVVLSYTALDMDVSNLYMSSSKTGKVVIADEASYPGIAFFVLEDGMRGNWEMYVPKDMDLGTYSAVVMDAVDCYVTYGMDVVNGTLSENDGRYEDELSNEE